MGRIRVENMVLSGKVERGIRRMGAQYTGWAIFDTASLNFMSSYTENLKAGKTHLTFTFQYFSTGC
jgi:hypothetical protein